MSMLAKWESKGPGTWRLFTGLLTIDVTREDFTPDLWFVTLIELNVRHTLTSEDIEKAKGEALSYAQTYVAAISTSLRLVERV